MSADPDPNVEQDFVLVNHMLDDTLARYREHGIMKYPPMAQTLLVYNNPHLRNMSVDDLVSLIAVMTVRLFETEPQSLPET